MIGRLWHGWTTTRENADPYDRLPRVKVLPGIDRVRGYKGAYLAVVPPEARNLTTTLDGYRQVAARHFERDRQPLACVDPATRARALATDTVAPAQRPTPAALEERAGRVHSTAYRRPLRLLYYEACLHAADARRLFPCAQS